MDNCTVDFEKHYLSLPFHTEGLTKECLEACSFDSEQDCYLPNNDTEECFIFACMLNTTYLSFKEQQKRIDELNQENQKIALSNTGYHNASASYLCKLMQIQFVLNLQIEIAKSKREDGEDFEGKTETKIADYLDDYNISLDKILNDEETQEQFNAYAKGTEFLKQKARADKNQKQIDELQARVDAALQEIKGAARWIDEDAIDDPEFIKGGALRALKRLEQTLKRGEK